MNQQLIDRIQNYLGNGGLFNPEMMEHDKVRDLMIDLRNHLDGVESAVKTMDERAVEYHQHGLTERAETCEDCAKLLKGTK